MLSEKQRKEFYQALIAKDCAYEGKFFVGVKTTGIFCRPTCPARKPKFDHCEFFTSAKDALLASFRPCIRCKPLSHPNEVSSTVQRLLQAIENNPEKRWRNFEFKALAVDASTARRQFKKRFGMTFIEYARARRMGLAMQHIKKGDAIIDAQLSAGYESSSGFRDAFSKIMGCPPSQCDKHQKILKANWIDTHLGPMITIADEDGLYLLEFVDRRGLEKEIERLRNRIKAGIFPGINEPINSIKQELKSYFEGTLKNFKTKTHLLGTSFQKIAWTQLCQIPYGETRSYSDQAQSIGRPSSFRAVANANGVNQLAIIIPCHRVINNNGLLGGYGGGLHRKQWLLDHEKNQSHC